MNWTNLDWEAIAKRCATYKVVYFDMDGPLCKFDEKILQMYNAPCLENMKLTPEIYEKARTDIIAVGLAAYLGVDSAKTSAEIMKLGTDFWESLEPNPEGLALWKALQGHTHTQILSSFRDSDFAAAGKVLWLKKHLGIPKAEDYRVTLTTEKELNAKPGRLLIDDSPTNCEAFRKEGGDALLWPFELEDFAAGVGEGDSETRRLILDTAEDAGVDFAFYNRKEDEELTLEAFRKALKDGVVTLEEVAAAFIDGMAKG